MSEVLFNKKRLLSSMAAAVAIALSLSACSAAENDESKGGPGNESVSHSGERFGTADEETAKLGTDAEPGQFPRTIKHANGETEIKEKPERVVVLDMGELDSVLSLGIKPVGMVTSKGANPVPDYLADKVKDVPSVGTIQEVNVEKIAELKPDLIVGSQLRVDDLYGQLSDIAPTVLAIRPGYPWKEDFRLIGDALGEEEKTVDILNDYADTLAQIKEKMPKDTTVSMLRFMPDKIRLYANKSLIGVILRDAGLARPENQDIDELAAEISPESISEADGDYLFYSSYGDPSATGEDKIVESEQFKNLSAVKEGKAFRVSDDLWFLGLGPTGAKKIAEELVEYLDVK